MPAKIMLTFDDGTKDQLFANLHLKENNLKGVFGVIPSKVNTFGYLSTDDLKNMQDSGHYICNHSYSHLRSKDDAGRRNVPMGTIEQFFDDCVMGKEWLNDRGFNGGSLIVPYGTDNIYGEYYSKFVNEFDWMRFTIGNYFPERDTWLMTGNKRLYSDDYNYKVIGITCAADARFPNEVKRWIYDAIDTDSICVICYHQINHMNGREQNITIEQFEEDISFISSKQREGLLETITPEYFVND